MMAYLVNMAARLIPLHQALKSTGSLYLHCDPTASHYLKVILDVIFGKKNFINEIIWFYKTGGASKRHFARKHDTIFFYTKSDNYVFNIQKEKSYMMHEYGFKKSDFFKDERGQYTWVYMKDVWEIPAIGSADKERLGYPTQKPEELLKRIIECSTNEGDFVLDPFCGCGTTVAVAERLKRRWVGIDISILAINIIEDRLKRNYPHIELTIDGIPMDYEGAQRLAESDKFAFQNWAISLIGAYPPTGEARKGADRGIDGLILFHEAASFAKPHPKLRKIVVQVKGGSTGRGDVAKLKGDMDREDAPMGVLITLNEPTPEMRREAALAGEYQYSATTSFPKIQMLSMKDWFAGRNVKLPSDTVNPFKKAEVKADQESLLAA
jgi:hypothetical protein